MKKYYTLILLCFVGIATSNAQYTSIPDANFEAALSTYDDIADDGQVPTARIENVTELILDGSNISDLSGIGGFISLEVLSCSNNNLTSLDLSKNTKLISLNAVVNRISSIDLSKNSNLTRLNINRNNLTSIDISKLNNLTFLSIWNNSLTTLDATQNPLLDALTAFGNSSITEIDVTQNLTLRELVLSNCSLSEIDLSKNPNLTGIYLENTNLNSIDLTNNDKLKFVYLSNNLIAGHLDLSTFNSLIDFEAINCNLTALNLKNGNNTAIDYLDVTDNPNLTCILVDDVVYSTANWTRIEDFTTFNDTDCTYVAIPDVNFEAALETLGYDDISGDRQVPRINIQSITSLNIQSKDIADLTGISAFAGLTELRVNSNLLTSVDLSKNQVLETLFIGKNSLTNLDLSTNTKLEYLSVTELDLSAGIDLSKNRNLTTLSAVNTGLHSIDLSNNTALQELNLSENPITSLDITSLTNLETLTLHETSLTTIDVSNNTLLVSFNFDKSNFTSLDFSGLSNLETIDGINNNNLTSLVLNGNSSLENFQVNFGLLTTLDFSDAINLTFLSASGHQLESLDLSNSTMLTTIQLFSNNLTSLDLRNIDLTKVKILNIDQNPDLSCVSVDDVAYARGNFTANVEYSIGCEDYTYIPDDNFEAALSSLDDTPNDNYVPTASIENLTSLDISNNNIADITGLTGFTSLTTLNASGNALKIVDFSGNPNLENINLNNNVINLLDVSGLVSLTSLEVNNNELLFLNIKNGANTSLAFFDATNNIDLACIVVDNENYATDNFIDIDGHTSFNETKCNPYVTIPDAAFETALAAYDDISSDNQIPLINIYYLTNLDVGSLGISDVTGIEYFASLTSLNIADNALTTVHLSDNVFLENLIIENNQLTALDLSKNSYLKEVDCDNNFFTSLDFSNNVNLILLNADDNANLTTINVTGCIALKEMIVDDNDLNAIDLMTNTNLKNVDLDNNNLTSIDLTKNTLLEDVDLEANNLTSMDFSQNILLEDVDVDRNQVTSLDFTNNIELRRIDIDNNALLTSVVFGNGLKVRSLFVDGTAIETIDVSMLEFLQTLDVSDTNVKALDLSSNRIMFDLLANNTDLESLDIKNGNNGNYQRLEANGNPNLFCILVDDVDYAIANWTVIDAQTSFSDTSCNPEVTLAMKVFLQGATINPNSGEESLMRDDLRAAGLIPTTSPYSDSLSCDAAVFTVTGNNAIIDWVWVELRDRLDASVVIAGQSTLLQRDGDIVTIDGVSDVGFSELEDNYYILVKHRNHLGILSANTIALSTTVTNIDFTNDTSLIQGDTNAVVDMGNNSYAILTGDQDENGQVQNTDINSVITTLGGSGYSDADMDMNGQIQNTDINNLMNPNIGKGEQF